MLLEMMYSREGAIARRAFIFLWGCEGQLQESCSWFNSYFSACVHVAMCYSFKINVRVFCVTALYDLYLTDKDSSLEKFEEILKRTKSNLDQYTYSLCTAEDYGMYTACTQAVCSTKFPYLIYTFK